MWQIVVHIKHNALCICQGYSHWVGRKVGNGTKHGTDPPIQGEEDFFDAAIPRQIEARKR